MQYKLKHRLSAALMAGAMCCTMIPAASAEEISTPEIADTFVPEITDSVTPDLSQITENLYNDLPDAPTGSYLGSMGLPVATGETKISISAWVSDLYDGTDAHMDADALNGNESTVIVGRNPDADYAVVPLLVQTEYPANSATAEVVLPLPGSVSKIPQAASRVQMTRSNYLQRTAKLKMHLEKFRLMRNPSVRPLWSRTAFIFSSRTKNSKSMATCCALLRPSRWNTFHPDRRNTSR